jgi:hypothetical protein
MPQRAMQVVKVGRVCDDAQATYGETTDDLEVYEAGAAQVYPRVGTRKGYAMFAAFGFEAMGVVVGDMYFVDPTPLEGQETPERGVRLELRLVDRAEPQGSIYAGVPIAFTRPVWRVDLFGSTESPPGTLDRAHHHPRFNGWEPSRRNFVPELSADPLSWLAGELADPDAVLARAGVDADDVSDADKAGLAAAGPEIVATVKRMLDGVRSGELAPAPAERVAATRTGWL